MPKTEFIDYNKDNDLQEVIHDATQNLNFPIIVKPRISSFVKNSHDLLIVRDKEVLLQLL